MTGSRSGVAEEQGWEEGWGIMKRYKETSELINTILIVVIALGVPEFSKCTSKILAVY